MIGLMRGLPALAFIRLGAIWGGGTGVGTGFRHVAFGAALGLSTLGFWTATLGGWGIPLGFWTATLWVWGFAWLVRRGAPWFGAWRRGLTGFWRRTCVRLGCLLGWQGRCSEGESAQQQGKSVCLGFHGLAVLRL